MGTTGELVDRAKSALKTVTTAVGQGLDTVLDEAAKGLGPVADKASDLLLAAGRLLHPKDLSVPSFSMYIAESLGIQRHLDSKLPKAEQGTGQVMGVFVPSSVKSLDKVNIILYMHGDKVRVVKNNYTIREYWSLPEFPLRQGLNASGQPYILLAPTLGPDADTQFGSLGSDIDTHLENAMVQLHRYGAPQFAPPKPPAIGDIIIAGHSGAFGPISSILRNMKRYKGNIREIWGFDIMYGGTWLQFASSTIPVYAYFVDTAINSRKLAAAKNPNVFVMQGVEFFREGGKEKSRGVKHDNLMQKFWLDRLRRIGSNGSDPDDRKRMVKG
jgi:hypothetical protein